MPNASKVVPADHGRGSVTIKPKRKRTQKPASPSIHRQDSAETLANSAKKLATDPSACPAPTPAPIAEAGAENPLEHFRRAMLTETLSGKRRNRISSRGSDLLPADMEYLRQLKADAHELGRRAFMLAADVEGGFQGYISGIRAETQPWMRCPSVPVPVYLLSDAECETLFRKAHQWIVGESSPLFGMPMHSACAVICNQIFAHGGLTGGAELREVLAVPLALFAEPGLESVLVKVASLLMQEAKQVNADVAPLPVRKSVNTSTFAERATAIVNAEGE